MADKINENIISTKIADNKTIEQIFKEAHDYLEKLELTIRKLLKKFHLNSK
jgi:glucuronate isomerase